MSTNPEKLVKIGLVHPQIIIGFQRPPLKIGRKKHRQNINPRLLA